ncbi:uncharacterized protein RCC_10020 [Ramularia collo-cygni]|uniref:Uncharacterized protein n=1 Tax=Ramularia collo-cygni TaxID=112498 RepID=A0A2D3VL76_9PEZI|nr:uncharacterized protein RCC_10020 [Ramularia collo-cygni]CZT24299.1 uncharacterized protein RCC_10020 [Ramularia collo-cygni]
MAKLFLAGSPDAESLVWDESVLAMAFGSPVRRFLGIDHHDSTEIGLTAASYPLAKWRCVPLGQRPHTAVPAKPTPPEDIEFASFHHDGDEAHLNFLEYSLAVLQNLDSSQIGPPQGTALEESTYMTIGSFGTSLSTDSNLQTSSGSLASYSSENPQQQIVNFSGQVTDLQNIPNARLLKSIHPQTMTVNILASVISVQPTRTVKLRKRTGEMEIVELLLGDETKAGFTTTFWLTSVESQAGRPPASNARQNGLRDLLDNLRSGDALLLTNIALAEFNSNVFGQSLSRHTTKNNTTVTVLSAGVVGLSAPVTTKLKRVKEWAGNFVGQGTKRAASPRDGGDGDGGRGKKGRHDTVLPPDTQYD